MGKGQIACNRDPQRLLTKENLHLSFAEFHAFPHGVVDKVQIFGKHFPEKAGIVRHVAVYRHRSGTHPYGKGADALVLLPVSMYRDPLHSFNGRLQLFHGALHFIRSHIGFFTEIIRLHHSNRQGIVAALKDFNIL